MFISRCKELKFWGGIGLRKIHSKLRLLFNNESNRRIALYAIYISNCSARENQLICVTMLRKLPWKRTGCTMGCCIGRQALSRVSLFHPTDMSNAGCISIYAPSQNSPRRGSLFLSSFLSSLFVLPAPGWRPARHFLSISRMFLRFPV